MNTKKNVKANTTAKSTGAEKKSETSRLVSAVKNLKAILPNITDKRLANKVSKALTAKTSTANSLEKLLDEVIKSGMPKKAVVENEVKAKKTIKKTVKEEPKTETKATKKPVAKKTEEKATAKKPTATKKESPVKSVKTTGDTKPPIALLFPDSLTKEIDGEKVTLRKAEDDEFTTIEEIATATEEGKLVVVACYWSARHLKQYDYAMQYGVNKVPKTFPEDLDLAQGVTISEMNKKFFAMSIYTEAMYTFYEEDLVPVEDKDPYTGAKYSVRVSNGMEFAVYVAD